MLGKSITSGEWWSTGSKNKLLREKRQSWRSSGKMKRRSKCWKCG
jgi:hypothetical protein